MTTRFKVLALVLIFTLVSVGASACITSTTTNTSSSNATGSSTPSTSTSFAFAPEPNGGSWKPFVLSSGDAIRLVPPPSSGSSQSNEELSELHALQLNRTAQVNQSIAYWNTGATVRWNEIARSLVSKHNTTPPMASRGYALLSVAQYDALVAAWNNKYMYNRSSPHAIDPSIVPAVQTSGDPVHPSEHAVVAAASSKVLSYLYPNETAFLSKRATADEQSRLSAGVNFRSDIEAGRSLGGTVAQEVINRAKNDGANTTWNGTVPSGPGKWYSSASPPQSPLLPNWGNVTPWLLSTSSVIMPPAPPAYGSQAFTAALNEVKQISDHRTPEQVAIAKYWADGAGTSTPPGHWNQIASDLITSYQLNELRSARTLALMNTAQMDAGICCWKCKYTYWTIRPPQADPTITTVVGLPNFPSYTSGHSSFSSAAGDVLSYIFPKDRNELQVKVQNASLSRLYAGIHYRYDCDQGVSVGRAVAQHAIERGEHDGSPS
ncbi:MAG: phosphatase PAP2 family protein [Halobacteriota archaeon]